jgi:hypothetical protein
VVGAPVCELQRYNVMYKMQVRCMLLYNTRKWSWRDVCIMSFVVHARAVDCKMGIEEHGRTAVQRIRSSACGTCAPPHDPSHSSAPPCPYPCPHRPPVLLPPVAIIARMAGWNLPPGMTILPVLLLAKPPCTSAMADHRRPVRTR